MDEIRTRMMQLSTKGYYCSQILLILGLEAQGKENPDLIRAVDGLAGGCSEGSCTCGCLTAGCCLLSLFAGKGSDHEVRNEKYAKMMKELVQWFWARYGFRYQGIDCMAITGASTAQPVKDLCWNIMESVYYRVMEILNSYGVTSDTDKCFAS
jgi:hypothetical protein